MAAMHLLNHLSPASYSVQEELLGAVKLLLESCDTWPVSLIYYAANDLLVSRHWIENPAATDLLSACLSFFGVPNVPPDALFAACDIPHTPRDLPHVVWSRLKDPASQLLLQIAKFDANEETRTTATKLLLDHFEKRADNAPTKALLKTLALFSVKAEVRQIAAKRMDQWLQNGKLQRLAIELLLYDICNLTDMSTPCDRDVLATLVRMRSLKSKQIMTIFQATIRQVVLCGYCRKQSLQAPSDDSSG